MRHVKPAWQAMRRYMKIAKYAAQGYTLRRKGRFAFIKT
jgi:hypothetical protein